ncbi:CBS domain-containing protein [Nocardioides albertanoniae]|nr:CBS domain-containing protein [Nocardioides albertanoniae]
MATRPTATPAEVEFDGGRIVRAPGEASVAEAMVNRPKVLPATSVARDVRDFFGDDHVHAALVCDGSRLLSVIERQDLTRAHDDEPATGLGTLAGRTVAPEADLWTTWASMTQEGLRRLAVVEDDRCVGLLCLKRSGRGFCCDAGVWARSRNGDRTPRVVAIVGDDAVTATREGRRPS